jgi:hypothetical protein
LDEDSRAFRKASASGKRSGRSDILINSTVYPQVPFKTAYFRMLTLPGTRESSAYLFYANDLLILTQL